MRGSLRSSRRVREVATAGTHVASRHFVMHAQPLEDPAVLGQGGNTSRVAVVAGKRVGNAVRRNRAKRRLREAFRQRRSVGTRGLDVVLIARSDLESLSMSTLIELVSDAFDRLQLRVTAQQSETVG